MHFARAQRRFSGQLALSGARRVSLVFVYSVMPHVLAFVTFARSLCVQNVILLFFCAADIASLAGVRFHKLRALLHLSLYFLSVGASHFWSIMFLRCQILGGTHNKDPSLHGSYFMLSRWST